MFCAKFAVLRMVSGQSLLVHEQFKAFDGALTVVLFIGSLAWTEIQHGRIASDRELRAEGL